MANTPPILDALGRPVTVKPTAAPKPSRIADYTKPKKPKPSARADKNRRAAQVIQQARRGQISPGEAQDQLSKLGVSVGLSAVLPAAGKPTYVGEQIGKAVHDVIGLPGGLLQAGGAVAGDVADTVQGRPTVKRTTRVAKATGQGLIETAKHPGRDLFQTALLGASVASVGAGAVGRAGAVRSVVKGAPAPTVAKAVGALSKAEERAYRVLANPGKHLPTIDEGTARLVATPSRRLMDVLDQAPELAAARRATVQALGEGKVVPRKLKAIEKPAAAARAVGQTKTAQVAKAAIKTPPPVARTLTVPGKDSEPALTLHPLASKNRAAGLVQKHVIDRARQRALNKGRPVDLEGPLARPAAAVAKRTSAQATVGRELAAQRAVTDALELAPVSRLERFAPSSPARGFERLTRGRVSRATIVAPKGQRLTGAEQKAIDIAASELPASEHIRYHQNLLDQGVGSAAHHRTQIALSKAAEPHLQAIAEGKAPRLAAAVEETRAVSRKGEAVKAMPAEEAAHRIGARRAEIWSIAAGEESPLQRIQRLEATVKGTRPVKDLDAEHADLTAKLKANQAAQAEYVPRKRSFERDVVASRPQTRVEAERELATLDARWERAVDATYQRLNPGGVQDRAETAYRNQLRAKYDRQTSGKSGAAARKVQRRPQTLSAELRQKAEDTLIGSLEANQQHPAARRMLMAKRRADELRAKLSDPDVVFGNKPAEAFGTRRQKLTGREPDAGLAKLRRHESLLRTRLDQLDTMREVRGIHKQLVQEGFKAVENGAFYLPSRDRALVKTKVPASREPSMYGLGPQGDAPWLAHSYTGALERSGRARTDATRLASESYRQAQRWATLDRGYRQLLTLAKDTVDEAGGEAFAVPIRTTVSIPDRFKELIGRQEAGQITRKEAAQLSQQDAEALARFMFPDPAELPAADLAKVKWVDGSYLGGLTGQGRNFGKADVGGQIFDLINSPFRAGLLYTKPAYALNLVQALGTNAIQQGAFTPVNLTRALRLGKTLGADDQHAVFSLVGQGLSRSFEAQGGFAKATINKAGETWNVVIDRYPRVASWLHEARREGFNTPEKIHALLNDERMRDTLVAVTRRANREAIEYGNLSPFEATYLRRTIFFYPWIRGATLYSLRFTREHPVQAAVYAQLGEQGHQQALNAFGPLAMLAPGMEGEVPFSGGRGANFRNLNTFQTPVETSRALASLFVARSAHANDLAQELGPAAGAFYTLISGKNTMGYELPAGKSRAQGAFEELSGLIPAVQAFRRAETTDQTLPPAKQPVFPKGPGAALRRYAASTVIPEKLNMEAATARGEKVYKAGLSPEQKARYNAAKEQRSATIAARQLHQAGVIPTAQVPKVVQRALKLKAARDLAYAKTGVKPGDYPAQAGAIAKVVTDMKAAPPEVVATFERMIAETADRTRQQQLIRKFWDAYGGGRYLSAWRHYATRAQGPR